MNFNYYKWNTGLGWLSFSLAFITYLLTIERNFSFWDCGEYISVASKLEVSHAPGAAFFQLVGACFSIFAFGNEALYPKIINATSALYSAFTILFLFWTISHLILKIFQKSKLQISDGIIKINALAGALVGSLSFAFTDTFWFSAVEGEVYAMASCFIAMLLWLICRFENASTKKDENRWILLISFIIGISVGIHMMVLLTIPSLCFIYYVKHKEFSWKSFFIVNGIVFLIFFIIFQGIFPYIMKIFGNIEMFFVNELNAPFHIGTIVSFFLLFCFFLFGIQFTIKYKLLNTNLVLLSLLFMLIGFSCWLVIPIRANANPPINFNNPNTAMSMLDYYNRDQYGDSPILYGPNYTAYLAKDGILRDKNNNVMTKLDGIYYEKDNKKKQYVKVGEKLSYLYNPKHKSWFPRMYSSDPMIMENYASLTNYPGFDVDDTDLDENQLENIFQDLQDENKITNLSINFYQKNNNILNIKKPTNWENFQFFIKYQISFMFIRYFFWNYVGRQNDINGQYEINKGNWLSGINWFDEHVLKLGNQNLLSDQFKNASTNYYYFLPFILGMIGLFFQLNYDVRRFYALLALFLLTSIGIVIYTNVRPFEPRERDYAFVGSFYVFAIWIGIGASYLMSLIKTKKSYVLSGLIFILTMIIPLLLISQNWDDHDRSKRTLPYDQAYSYLHGLGDNAILFTYGDNDTYPLWAIQETFNFRRDIRAINYILLSSVWNIDQIKRKLYQSSPIPGKMRHYHYKMGNNDMIFVTNYKELNNCLQYLKHNQIDISQFLSLEEASKKEYMTPKEAMQYLFNSNNDILKHNFMSSCYQTYNKDTNVLPVNKLLIPVNKKNALRHGIVAKEDESLIVDSIILKIHGQTLRKDFLVFLDILANYNWDRPIYFSLLGINSHENLFFLQDYLQYEGLVYKFVPIKTQYVSSEKIGHVNPEKLYQNIKSFKWGNFKNQTIYYDAYSKNNIVHYREAVTRAVEGLIQKNKKYKARELLNLLEKEIPSTFYCFKNTNIIPLIRSYLLMQDYKQANIIMNKYLNNILQEFNYYLNIYHKSQKKTLFKQEIFYLQFEYKQLIEMIKNMHNLNSNSKKSIMKYINNFDSQFRIH